MPCQICENLQKTMIGTKLHALVVDSKSNRNGVLKSGHCVFSFQLYACADRSRFRQITVPRNVSPVVKIARKDMYVDVIVQTFSRVSLVLNLTLFFSFT